jgi:hypothetical protein
LFIFNVNHDEGASIYKLIGMVAKPISLSPRVKDTIILFLAEGATGAMR